MRRLVRFLRVDLWTLDLRTRAWPVRLALSALRVVAHTAGTYGSHQVGIRASGLSLITLLSVVPLLAVVFSIAGAFGFRESLEAAIHGQTRELPEGLANAVQQIEDLVNRTSFQALGGIGTLVLVWTGLSLFARVEESLNFAWRTRGRRAWLHRVTSFLALVVLVPVMMVGALAITAALRDGPFVAQLRLDIPWLMRVYDAGLWLVPHGMAWIAFSALYLFLPSADVRWRPALVAGVLAGSSLLAMHQVYIDFQVGVARTNAIYATLAALPLLLVYLQLAWTIVLLGAEVGYAVQHIHLIGPGRDPDDLPFALRERLALRLLDRATAQLDAGAGPLGLSAEARQLDVPVEWLDAVVGDLERGGLLAAVRTEQDRGESVRFDAVLPRRPGRQIGLAEVRAALRGAIATPLEARIELSEAVAATVAEVDRWADERGRGLFVHDAPARATTEPA